MFCASGVLRAADANRTGIGDDKAAAVGARHRAACVAVAKDGDKRKTRAVRAGSRALGE